MSSSVRAALHCLQFFSLLFCKQGKYNTHTVTHTHIYIYIYIYTSICSYEICKCETYVAMKYVNVKHM